MFYLEFAVTVLSCGDLDGSYRQPQSISVSFTKASWIIQISHPKGHAAELLSQLCCWITCASCHYHRRNEDQESAWYNAQALCLVDRQASQL